MEAFLRRYELRTWAYDGTGMGNVDGYLLWRRLLLLCFSISSTTCLFFWVLSAGPLGPWKEGGEIPHVQRCVLSAQGIRFFYLLFCFYFQ